MAQAPVPYPEGCRVRIEDIGSLSVARPDPARQSRAKELVGQDRTVIEADRYGYAWLSWDESAPAADFCLKPGDLSLVAPAPPKKVEAPAGSGESWSTLKRRKVTFTPSTAAVLATLAIFLVCGLAYRLTSDSAKGPASDSLWFLVPAGATLVATILAVIYGLRHRGLQQGLELIACAGLWLVLAVAT